MSQQSLEIFIKKVTVINFPLSNHKILITIYSTVTDLARLRGWSTSVPLITATW